MGKRLDSWKLVATWLHISVRQAQKLASVKRPESERLPIFRLARGPNTRVCADTDELDRWVERMKAITSNVRPAR